MGEFAWAAPGALRARTSMKWRAYPADVLPLWVAEMDVELAPAIRDALHRAVDDGDTGYAAGTEYAEALARFAEARWGWGDLPVARTAIVPDVMLGAVELLGLLSEPGDAVVVTPPVYAPFFAFIAHAGRRVVEAPLGPTGRLDASSLERAFAIAASSSRTPTFLMSNPHNPTGTVPTREELLAVARLAERHGVRVISDEIHGPLVLPGATFTPYLTVEGSEDAFALTSASKAWNLAGVKAALAIAGEAAAADLERMPEEVSHGCSHLGVIAHAASFGQATAWLDELVAALDANRTALGALLAATLPEIGFAPPEGTYFGWLDCTRLELDDPVATDAPTLTGEPAAMRDLSGPARFFLDRGRVALTAGHVFGTGGRGHARLNFATSPELLAEAVARMASAVAERRT